MAIRINVTSDINIGKFEARVERANHALANEVMKDTDKFVPFLTGTLKNSARVDGDTITYPGPYAHYQWEGIVYVDPKTGAAGIPTKTGFFSRPGVTKVPSGRKLAYHKQGQDHWIEPSKAANMDKWERFYAKEITDGD